MKTKLNKSTLFKQGNASELFESFIQKVDKNAQPNQKDWERVAYININNSMENHCGYYFASSPIKSPLDKKAKSI
ncbi:TPA: hypothetical protein JBE16_12230 [Legionella pneumophila subsp. pneumophila]|uniref:hypothetical protein n=1 Tax=Legionella sp. PATHC039 TaxID=2992042 RepID=UPI001A2CC6B9|nr:hypothetical protein [Legionella sp. PATHC039]MCW8396856.1 hypothetical protein [Legionella sp. PATHC039]HAT8858163.1 hypothetical protein [Legionella pneumophila subsp. pneumophila]HAT9650269.1 hypothetical protein [Legionella pneumophila subsp. pneumophila]HAT9920947.1 hypothetical protein [Legionella pneumophila subsp. pneumophila]